MFPNVNRFYAALLHGRTGRARHSKQAVVHVLVRADRIEAGRMYNGLLTVAYNLLDVGRPGLVSFPQRVV